MKLFDSRRRQKQQKQREKEIFNPENEGKGQFNVVIDKELRTKVQELAQRFRVNQSVFTEHLLQVALYYMIIVTKNEEKKKRLEQHLISTHLLNKHVDDEEVIIRLIEPNQNWMLLDHSKQAIAKTAQLKKALGQVSKTGDFGLVERAEKEMRRAILGFADYLMKHRFDDIEDY